MTMKNEYITMPALALRGLVIFPGMILHFDVARERSINAVEEAIENNEDAYLYKGFIRQSLKP